MGMPMKWEHQWVGGEETYLMLGGEEWSPRVGDISLEVIRIIKAQSQPYKKQGKE